jgi:lipopolysaccharide transport system ATP-binding protein
LKILSRITPPTAGRVELYGRTTSLLEVGTGFHPELTGRENIFLNGSILGLNRWEIFQRYEEIVEFSGVGEFIDTPVKRYSSGMFVRLAFSVAAHLNPEILIVDEVLAVGDMEFQRKSLEKMRATASAGRTVVFVSHDLIAVEELCDRVFVLEEGRIVSESRPGRPEEAVVDYEGAVGELMLASTDEAQPRPIQVGGHATVPEDVQRWGTGEAHIVEVTLMDLAGRDIEQLEWGQPFAVSVVYDWREAVSDLAFEVGISRADGQRIVTVQSIDGPAPAVDAVPGRQVVTVELPNLHLLPGQFTIDAACHRMDGRTVDHVLGAVRFEALNGKDGEDRYVWNSMRGYVRPESSWHGHDVALRGRTPSSHG